MSGGRTQTLKPMKHPKLNGGQRPVGLDQDSCISKKIEVCSDESKPQRGGNVRSGLDQKVRHIGRNQTLKPMKHPKLSGGPCPVGFRPRQLHFQKNLYSQAEGNQDSLQGGTSVRKRWRFVQSMENIRKPEETVGK